MLRALRPALEECTVSGVARTWFFVRYADPAWHLRLRVQGDPEQLRKTVQPRIEAALAPYLVQGCLWKVQLDTYDRELHRYGGSWGIEPTEGLFHRDSESTLEILEAFGGDEGLDARWRLALRGMALLLGDLGFDLRTRIVFLRSLREAYGRELGWSPAYDGPLGRKFRKERKSLEALLDPEWNEGPLAPGLAALRRRSERSAPGIEELRSRARQGRLTCSLEELAESYLHMHANRILRSAHRAQELVLYDFLGRLYESLQARGTRTRGTVEVAR
jgi:thiopeptide-type bacteriocin biosynthesis protein